MSYLIHDAETTTNKSFKRKANPFDPENWVVANGFKRKGGRVWTEYFTEKNQNVLPIKDEDKIIVGFNYKFDMLYHWKDENLIAFFKRGGRIWDCQYAEYLLCGQDPAAQMCSMDSCVERYGGKLKIDEVKAMWNAGINTPDIPKDLLLRYLAGDIDNTELIYLGQVRRAREQGQLNDLFERMDSICATTEMEYNGLYINRKQAEEDQVMLEGELSIIQATLTEALPAFPEGFVFNWGSPTHKSCLLFGGVAKYKKFKQYVDPETLKPIWVQKKEKWVLKDGKPYQSVSDWENWKDDDPLCIVDTNKGGKNKGDVKTKMVSVDDLTKPKGKITDFGFRFKGYTKADPKWAGALTDFEDKPIFSTAAEIIDELGGRGIEFLTELANRSKIAKDLTTYYLTTDKDGNEKGMLTCVMPDSIIHHSLNSNLSITSRLTSSNPNLQNVSRAEHDKALGRPKSYVKRMFSSRFGKDGRMTEADYSQLEVVVQGLLTGDPQLIADLKAKIDFHCKRLAAKEGMEYDEVFKLCKIDKLPEWGVKRTKTKEFTFQRAFGAALKSIAIATGMSLEDVQKLSDAEELLYPHIKKYYDDVERIAASNREPTSTKEPYPDKPEVWVNVGKGFYMSPLQGRYTFYEKPCAAWLRKKGIQTSLYRPHIQNYPIQGTAAQIVQYILGRLWRHFVSNDNYGGMALLVNTVHDCVWVDHMNTVTDDVRADVKRIMESVPAVLKEVHNLDLDGLEFPVEIETGVNMMELRDLSAQRAAIMDVFNNVKCRLSPCDVASRLPQPCLLTSVRSDITRLTELKLLVKTDETKIGIYDKSVFLWELKS